MTPNKLPPLPEYPVAVIYPDSGLRNDPQALLLWMDCGYDTGGEPLFSANQLHAYAAEALRQSQSLPAGAVAGLVQRWRDVAPAEQRVFGHSTTAGASFGQCADELEQALQADAREKGEADYVMVPREIPQAAFLAMEKAGVSFQTQQRVWPIMLDALATQPAQASEKDSRRLHDYPALLAFHSKHAIGALAAPSCLVCGVSTQGRDVSVKHLELPGVVVCSQCFNRATSGDCQ